MYRDKFIFSDFSFKNLFVCVDYNMICSIGSLQSCSRFFR